VWCERAASAALQRDPCTMGRQCRCMSRGVQNRLADGQHHHALIDWLRRVLRSRSGCRSREVVQMLHEHRSLMGRSARLPAARLPKSRVVRDRVATQTERPELYRRAIKALADTQVENGSPRVPAVVWGS